MKCNKCSAPAVIYQRYSGMSLCSTHFQEDVHRKIRETLRESGIFGKGAKIAVAVNGSADSATLAYSLKSLFSNRMDVELIAIMIDECIGGYRRESMDCARRLAEGLEIAFMTKGFGQAFRQAFGRTVDEIAGEMEPCRACTAMRNDLLNRAASEIGADAIAAGHNLDDEAGDVMLKYLRGDVKGLLQPGARGGVPVIRPLRRVPAKETRLYAKILGLVFGQETCPYACGMRLDAKAELQGFEMRHPGTNYSLLRSLKRLEELRHLRDEKGQSL